MRILVLALVVIACGRNSAPTGDRAGSSVPTSLEALADQACACKDAACRDTVHDRVKARPAPQPGGDPSRMSQQEILAAIAHDVADHAAEMRLYQCLEPEHGAAAVTARVAAFAERACACARSDAGCLETVRADFDRYLEIVWLLQDDYTPADKQGLQDQMRKFEICRQVGPS